MKFSINFDSATVNEKTLGSQKTLVEFENQITAAANIYSAAFADPVTVNVTVEYGKTGLASTNQTYYGYQASVVQDALKKDVTSLDDLKTSNAFNATGTVYLTHAQLKALGIIAADAPGTDATVTFSDTAGIFDFTHSTAMSPTSYDLFGAAAHEFSEVMGRVVDVGSTSTGVLPTALSQFRSGGNFTIGTETLYKFNATAGADLGDWDSSVPASDAFRAFASPGVVAQVSATDLRTVDVVGWDHQATDLVLAIDTTGSMGPYINNVKANAAKIVNAAFGSSGAPIDTRIGIVGFKDAAGPNGPGDNYDLLNFTEQDTYDARKQAALSAINAITVGGGGDIPEGDNSALLYALKGSLGDWRRAAQSHKIILFTDAPIKDTGLADQVAAAAKKLDVQVTGGSIGASSISGSSVVAGVFTLSAPASAFATTDSPDSGTFSPDPAADVEDGPAPATISFSVEVYAIQVGSDSTATASLENLASTTGGSYLTGSSSNLADVIVGAINTLPPTVPLFIDDFNGTNAAGESSRTSAISAAGTQTGAVSSAVLFADGSSLATLASGSAEVVIRSALSAPLALPAGYLVTLDQTASPVSITGSGEANELVYATSGGLTYDFNGGSGVVYTGSATDTSGGAASGDRITLSGDAETVISGEGSDTIVAASGHHLIATGAGATSISLSNGTDTVYSEGADTIQAGSGTVSIVATGSAHVGGGSGSLAFFGGDGAATVSGNTGVATIAGGAGGGLFFAGTAGASRIAAGSGNASLIGAGPGDTLFGGTGNSTMFGSSGSATFVGGAGTNEIVCDAGPNTVFGGSGSDTIWSETGALAYIGGTGTDLIALGPSELDAWTGTGSETFMAIAGHATGNATIVGFQVGLDKIALYGYDPNAVQVKNTGADTVVKLGETGSITLTNVQESGATLFA